MTFWECEAAGMLSIGSEFLPAEWFSAEAKIAGPESFGGKKGTSSFGKSENRVLLEDLRSQYQYYQSRKTVFLKETNPTKGFLCLCLF